MGSNWKRYSFEDCMEAIIDYRGKTPKKTTSGIPLITAKIIKNGSIQPVKEFIAEDDYESWMRRGIPKAGDVVLTTEAPLGEVAQLDERKIALAQRVITLRGKTKFLDNTFLKYLLISSDVQHQLDGRGTGTTVKGIKQSELRQLELPIPDFNTQLSIAKILGDLDKKIHLNNETNETLEQMAQALFKSWFVDFDPVFDNLLASADFNLESLENRLPDELKLKAQRRLAALDSLENAAEIKASLIALDHELQALSQTKEATQAAVQVSEKAAETTVKANFNANTNILAQHANTHAHFPNEFEHNEQLGWIPKGWVVSELGGFINFSNGKAIKTSEEGAYPIYGANGIIGRTSEVKFNNAIIIGRVGAYCGAVEYCRYKFWSSDNTIVASSKISEQNNPHILYLLKYFDLNQYAGGAAQPLLNQTTLNKLKTAVPSDKCLISFNKIVDDILIQKVKNNSQTATLSSLRDTLLPKLISGEVQV